MPRGVAGTAPTGRRTTTASSSSAAPAAMMTTVIKRGGSAYVDEHLPSIMTRSVLRRLAVGVAFVSDESGSPTSVGGSNAKGKKKMSAKESESEVENVLRECARRFLSLVASEAGAVAAEKSQGKKTKKRRTKKSRSESESETKKRKRGGNDDGEKGDDSLSVTLTADNVLDALRRLEFTEYGEALQTILSDIDATEQVRKKRRLKRNRMKLKGLSAEEVKSMADEQEKLFAAAATRAAAAAAAAERGAVAAAAAARGAVAAAAAERGAGAAGAAADGAGSSDA